jgi:hypothetical protein
MNKGLAAINNQLGRRLGYAVTAGSVFSSSESLSPGDPAPDSGNNIITDDGTVFVTSDGSRIIYST